MPNSPFDPMEYLPDMERIDPSLRQAVCAERAAFDAQAYTQDDVRQALRATTRTPRDFAALLSPAADGLLEEIALAAQKERRRYFGTNVQLFTPVYIANYCENHCVYCGFNRTNRIRRARLDAQQIEEEMAAVAATGLEEVLILTGESHAASSVDYIAEACSIARRHLKTVGVEVYPMNTEGYARLHAAGADYVTVFQETYDPQRYGQLHLGGHKRVFPYRMETQERALRGGMRGVAFAALLGLDDARADAYATGMHAYLVQRRYPHAEISLSCPRLRPTPGSTSVDASEVSERLLLQIMCAYRLFLPFAGLTISTRERAGFRDNAVAICATKMSAGVHTGVGGHNGAEQGDDQFEIADGRSLAEVTDALRARNLQPVMNDYVYV